MKQAKRPGAVGRSRSGLLAVALVLLTSIIGFTSLAAGGAPEAQRQPARPNVLARDTAELQARTAQTPAVQDDSDTDIPGFAQGLIDHDEYLRLREEHIARLRGLPYDLPYNARTLAIQQMHQQMDRQLPAAPLSNSVWSSIGPNPLPVPGSLSVSGRVTAIAIHPTIPDTVYVGTAQGGLYRSTDGGTNWTAILDQGASLAIGAVAISPSNPTTIFVGTGEANSSLDSFFGVGVYRIDNADTNPSVVGPFSTDGVNNVLSGLAVSQLIVSPTDPNTIWVSTKFGSSGIGGGFPAFIPNPGVFRSTNAASSSVTFTSITVAPISQFTWQATDLAFEPGNPANLLCAVQGINGTNTLGGIYRSTNATSSTPAFLKEISLPDQMNVKLAINKVGSTVTAVAATAEDLGSTACPTGGLLRKSTDGGQTWSAGLPASSGFCLGQCWYNIGVAIAPNDASVLYVGGNGNGNCGNLLERSTDGGGTFASVAGHVHTDTHAIAVAPSNPAIVYTGNDGGIYRSTDSGSTWTSLNQNGFIATQFESLALHPTDREFMIGGTQDNGTERRAADGTWVENRGGDGGVTLIDQNATDTTNVTMYHTFFNRTNAIIGFEVSTDAGNTWPNFYGCGGTANGINCSDNVLFYAPMALGPGNPNTVYFGTDRLYRSTNKGVNMTLVSQAPISTGVISAIGISPQNDSVRLVGLNNGKVFRTTTGSSTLNDVTGPIPVHYIARAVIDPNNSDIAYVSLDGYGLASGQHVWKTANLSAATPTWTAAGSGIPDVPVNAFVVDKSNSSNLYAGTDIGVYRSTDGGGTWNVLGTGLPHVAVFDMAIENGNRVLRVATHGKGIWEISIAANNYIGFIDHLACDSIGGWAADQNRLNTSINVEIYDGTTLISTVLASNSRTDVGAFLGDNGLHGFNIATPAALKDGAAHNVHVKFETGVTELSGSPAGITCAGTPNYIGFVDHAGCDLISGWAADHNRLNTSINIEIYDGTTLISTVLASNLRSDVGAFLGDNGMHGFSVATPASLKDGATHSVHIKFETSATELSNSPASINCSGTPNYIGFVDHTACDTIAGWAADRNRLNVAINVEIYDGTTLIAVVPATNSRTDVGAFLGDNGLHGFAITTPASLKTGSAQTVHIKFEASSTELSGSPSSINCPSLTPNYVGYADHVGCDVIAGWVADRNRLNTPITVSIYANNVLIATVQANTSRPDVGAFLGDNGLHGFSFPTPATLKGGITSTINIRFELSGTDLLSNSPFTLTCP